MARPLPSPLERGPLTDHILEAINATEIWIGDAVPPEDGGWDLSPDSAGSKYQAYGVLVPGTTGNTSGPVADTTAEVQAVYAVNGYGVSRSHCERYMDHVRKVLVAMSRTMVVLGDSSWKILQVRCDTIGGIARNDSVEPSEYSETDVYVLYLSKEL